MNPLAIIAFVVAATPTAILALVPAFGAIAPFSWPIGVVVSGVIYRSLVIGQPVPGTLPHEEATKAAAV